jgi:hypothetical protein
MIKFQHLATCLQHHEEVHTTHYYDTISSIDRTIL